VSILDSSHDFDLLPGFEQGGLRSELRSLAREVAKRELIPNAHRWDEEADFPEGAFKALAEADICGLTIPEDYGGSGLGDVEAAVVLEELARADVSSAIIAQLCLNGPPRTIAHLGSPALKEKWLPRVARGELFLSIGITEPDAGSAAGSMRATLSSDGDGYRLNAYKNYSTGGARAGGCLVWCRFPGGSGVNGIGAVVIDTASEGVSIAGVHRNMGIRGSTEAELAFDDVRVEPEDVLIRGHPDSAETFWKLVNHLNHERCGNAAMCIGAAQGALERAVDHLNSRSAGGKKLASFQGLQWKVADMTVRLEGARMLLYKAVALAGINGGTPPSVDTSIAKVAANLAAKYVCDEAIQLLGGYGYSREESVERAFRDVRGLCIGGGTVEVQKNLIGQSVLKGVAPFGPAWLRPGSGEAANA
jgi:alkylation response protein AidB-like acyl-CoA dehydrogenase